MRRLAEKTLNSTTAEVAAGHASSAQGAPHDRRIAPYPLYLYLDGQPVVVVGAGAVAERKIATLLERGASVTVVAPDATDEVKRWAADGRIRWHERGYRTGDLAGALLVIGSTSDEAVNRLVFDDACKAHQLVNIVDVPELCTCIVPSIMRRGQLQIAVSSAGAAPTIARDIRHGLEEAYPAYWADYIDLLGDVRMLVKQRVEGPASARRPLYEAVAASDLLERIAAGERPEAEDVYAAVVMPLLEGGMR
ncbi:precorrin-2 dehydrogenase/sirohydrochlorin ferrochelatase family protein [Slackia exigua]